MPSGVVTMVCEILSHWPERKGQKLMVLCNKDHWAYYKFEALKRNGHIDDVIRCPFLTTQDIVERIKVTVKNPVIAKCLRLFMRIIRPFYSLVLVWRIKRLLSAYRVDALFSHNGGYPGGDLSRIVVISARYAGVANNYMVIHNLPSPSGAISRRVDRFENRWISACVKGLFSVSNACASKIQRDCFPWSTVNVLPNAIQTPPAPSTAVSAPPPWRGADTVIGFVGELHPRKGLDVLFTALRRSAREFNLILIGNGEKAYTDALEARADNMRRPGHVFFLGFLENALEMIRHFDIVVLPSIAYESFGMVILEAMYWGKPVICSDLGGMKEVVRHEQTGLVVPAGDPDALQQAVEYLIDHPEARSRLGRSGYQRLIERYDIEALSKRYHALS